MLTYADQLTKHNVEIPDHLIADAEVPILTGPQRQGDVLIVPFPVEHRGELVPAEGVAVVRGESTTGSNSHILDGAPEAYWYPVNDDGVELGYLTVPDGSTAYLTHTDEHGCNGIGPGNYVLRGKREQAEVERRVAD